jgi:hypothetical protein
VEPWLYGASTGVSAVALVVSAIFWTWLWGSIGLLLATPLTVCIAVLGRHVPQLRFLDILLGNEAPLRPEESFYQRLLAGDPDEASEQAEDFLKTRPLLELDDEVVIPALVLAERDRARGVLDAEGRDAIVTGLTLVFQNIDEEIRRARGRLPPNAPDESALQLEPLGKGTVLCVGGRGNLDEAASQVLARYLTIEGYRTETLSLESALKPFAGPELPQASVVCLSYMDPDSVPHARYLGRRFRRALGSEASLLVIFWGADQGAMVNGDLQKSIGADSVATSLAAAVAVIDARLKTEDSTGSDSAKLDSLAEKAARMVSQTA